MGISRKKFLSAIAVIFVGIYILLMLWQTSSTRLITIFRDDDSNEQGQAIKKLNERLMAGRLSQNDIDKIMEIVVGHLEKRARATRENSSIQSRIWAEELNFGWNTIEKNLASDDYKMQFLNDIIIPSCQYITYPQPHRFELNGQGDDIPAGSVCRYQLIVYDIDGKDTEQKIMDQYLPFKTTTSITFGLHELLDADLNPSQSLSVKLITTWYHVSSEIISDLPTSVRDPQDIEKMNNILKMDSTQKICEYSKTTTLIKSDKWKNYF
jgi:hypothetical protein